MNKKDLKEKAQEKLLHGLCNSFYGEDLTKEVKAEMSKQMGRVEKLFGFEPNSWIRG